MAITTNIKSENLETPTFSANLEQYNNFIPLEDESVIYGESNTSNPNANDGYPALRIGNGKDTLGELEEQTFTTEDTARSFVTVGDPTSGSTKQEITGLKTFTKPVIVQDGITSDNNSSTQNVFTIKPREKGYKEVVESTQTKYADMGESGDETFQNNYPAEANTIATEQYTAHQIYTLRKELYEALNPDGQYDLTRVVLEDENTTFTGNNTFNGSTEFTGTTTLPKTITVSGESSDENYTFGTDNFEGEAIEATFATQKYVAGKVAAEAAARDTAIINKIKSLQASATGGAGKYISTIKQTDGQIAATEVSFDTDIETQSSDNNAPTTQAVSNYVTHRIKNIKAASKGGNGKYISAIEQTDGSIAAIETTLITNIDQDGKESSVPATSEAIYALVQKAIKEATTYQEEDSNLTKYRFLSVEKSADAQDVKRTPIFNNGAVVKNSAIDFKVSDTPDPLTTTTIDATKQEMRLSTDFTFVNAAGAMFTLSGASGQNGSKTRLATMKDILDITNSETGQLQSYAALSGSNTFSGANTFDGNVEFSANKTVNLSGTTVVSADNKGKFITPKIYRSDDEAMGYDLPGSDSTPSNKTLALKSEISTVKDEIETTINATNQKVATLSATVSTNTATIETINNPDSGIGAKANQYTNNSVSAVKAELIGSEDDAHESDNTIWGAKKYAEQYRYELAAATDQALGGIKVGYSTTDNKYALQIDTKNQAFIEVHAATSTVQGVVRVDDQLDNISTNPVQNKVISDAIGEKYTISDWNTVSTSTAPQTNDLWSYIKYLEARIRALESNFDGTESAE